MPISIGGGIRIGGGITIGGASIVSDGLITYLDALYYPGSGTNWPDNSGNGNDCTLVSPDYNPGPPAYLNFNGGNFGLMGSILNKTAYSKCAMIYVGAYISNNIISGRAGDYHAFWMAGTNYLQAGHNGAWTTVSGATYLNLNQWYFVGVTFNTTTGWKLYLNGAVDGINGDPTTFIGSDPGDCNIGAFEDGNNFYGRIPVAMVYNRVLSDAEMLTNFNALRSRFGI